MNHDKSIPTEAINALNTRCYNAKADYWDRFPFANVLPKQILLLHNRTAGMRALDIGSGTGMLADWLVKEGFDVLCLDPSDEMVRRSRAKGLNTLQTTLQDFSCHEKFGLIASVLSLIHIPKREVPAQIKRLSSWLNPKGTFILALIEGKGEGIGEEQSTYPRYFSYYTRQEVMDLTKKDFNCLFEMQTPQSTSSVSYLIFVFQKRDHI